MDSPPWPNAKPELSLAGQAALECALQPLVIPRAKRLPLGIGIVLSHPAAFLLHGSRSLLLFQGPAHSCSLGPVPRSPAGEESLPHFGRVVYSPVTFQHHSHFWGCQSALLPTFLGLREERWRRGGNGQGLRVCLLSIHAGRHQRTPRRGVTGPDVHLRKTPLTVVLRAHLRGVCCHPGQT